RVVAVEPRARGDDQSVSTAFLDSPGAMHLAGIVGEFEEAADRRENRSGAEAMGKGDGSLGRHQPFRLDVDRGKECLQFVGEDLARRVRPATYRIELRPKGGPFGLWSEKCLPHHADARSSSLW